MTRHPLKSKFVIKKIRSLSFTKKNREYVEALVRIDNFHQGHRFGMFTGYIIQGLKEKYPKEWDFIGKEIKDNHIPIKEERKLEELKHEILKKELKELEKREEEREREFWKKYGA